MMIAQKVASIRNFLQVELWKVKLDDLPWFKAWFYRCVRVLMITFSEFEKDKCTEKASALTFFSLLSIVPVVALAFGIATAFGLEKYLERELTNYFSGQQEVLDYTIEFANRMLDTANGGVISGISALFLIYSVTRLLSSIEMALNDIWETEKGRSLTRRLSDYMSVILLGPLILIISGSVTVFVTTRIESITEQVTFLGYVQPFIVFLIGLIPSTLIWFLLFLIYIIFPNTKVKPMSALLAGIVAGTVFQLTQWAWINGQVYLSNYNVVYGSFAALPLFLIWLQLSWTIVLIGAELAFAVQNVKTWSYDSEKLRMDLQTRRKMTFLALYHIVSKFEQEGGAVGLGELNRKIPIPHRFIREILSDLQKSGLISGINNDEQEPMYQPAMDIHKISLQVIQAKLDAAGASNFPGRPTEKLGKIEELMGELKEAAKASKANILLKDL